VRRRFTTSPKLLKLIIYIYGPKWSKLFTSQV